MKLHCLPRQVPEAKLSNTHWAPADLSWPGAFKPASLTWIHRGLIRHELALNLSLTSIHTASCVEPFLCSHGICKNWAFLNSLIRGWNCQSLHFLFFFWGGNADYAKGPVFVTWHPNFTPKKPMDNSLFIRIPNTNQFSWGQLGLLAKKVELT